MDSWEFVRQTWLTKGKKRGVCGHVMAGFDLHSTCVCCRDKGKDPCAEKPESACKFCDIVTSDQRAQFSTPSDKLKKETTGS